MRRLELERMLALVLIFLLAAWRCEAQRGADAEIAVAAVTFHLNRVALPTDNFSIQMQTNGLGAYWKGPPDLNLEEAVGVSKITLSPETIRRVMGPLPVVKAGHCETHMKNIAQTGLKTILYAVEGAAWRCEFNYSDDDLLNAAAATFEAVAETMQFGERLQHLHRFDRLGLDAEIDSLAAEAQAGRAIELQNIAPALQSVMDDERVIERARRKAGRLLQAAGVALPARPPPAANPR